MSNEQGNSKTVPKQLKPFVKGDPRINRKGRPKTFDQLRELAQQIAHEPATVKDKDGNTHPIIIDGHQATTAEMILRQWTRDSKHQEQFIKVAFGDVPLTIRTWQDEIIDMLKAGKIKPDDVESELGKPIATPLLIAAGIRRDESAQAENASAEVASQIMASVPDLPQS